jgi:hypothetical protein
VLHVPSAHTLDWQRALALGYEQIVPHIPQLAVSFVVFVSQPFVRLPSQDEYPVEQAGLQTPVAQLVVPWAFVHALPHEPQLARLVDELTSHPSE